MLEAARRRYRDKGEVTVRAKGAVGSKRKFAVADWAKAMVVLGDGAALQPRINNTSRLLPHLPPSATFLSTQHKVLSDRKSVV